MHSGVNATLTISILAFLVLDGCSRSESPAAANAPMAQAPPPAPELTPAGQPARPAVASATPFKPPDAGFTTASVEAAPTAAARERLAAALSLQKKGQYDEALRALESLRGAELPRDLAAEVIVEIGETHFRLGQEAQEGKLEGIDIERSLRTAASLYQDVSQRFPDVRKQAAVAAYMLGSSHLLLGEMGTALSAYERCYAQFDDPEWRPKALVRVGVCQSALGRASQAGMTYIKFLREYPAHAEVERVRKYTDILKLVGRPAPEVRADSWLVGTAREGLAGLRGEVVMLIFFSTGCPHCNEAMPQLARDVARWTARGVLFIGISNPDDPDAKTPIDVYLGEKGIELYDVAIDRTERNWSMYRVSGLPAGALIDRKGVLRWRAHVNFLGQDLFETLLREPPGP